MKTYDFDQLPLYKLKYFTKEHKPLTSNWPPPEKFEKPVILDSTEEKVLWFVDAPNGITIATCDTSQDAERTRKACGPGYEVRPYLVDDALEHEEQQQRKEAFRQGVYQQT